VNQDPPGGHDARPFADSLCWRCANHRPIRAARSTFVMCAVLQVKYPRQPVLACADFQPTGAEPPR